MNAMIAPELEDLVHGVFIHFKHAGSYCTEGALVLRVSQCSFCAIKLVVIRASKSTRSVIICLALESKGRRGYM